MPVRPCPKSWSSPKTEAICVEVYVPSRRLRWAAGQAWGEAAWAMAAGSGWGAGAGRLDGAAATPGTRRRFRRSGVGAPLQHGVLLEQAVEADHPGHRAAEGGGDLRGRRVHDGPGGRRPAPAPTPAGSQRGRHHRRRAADREQGAPRLGRADGQPLAAQRGGHLGHLGRRSARTALHTAPQSGSAGSRASRGRHGGHRLGQAGRVCPARTTSRSSTWPPGAAPQRWRPRAAAVRPGRGGRRGAQRRPRGRGQQRRRQ